MTKSFKTVINSYIKRILIFDTHTGQNRPRIILPELPTPAKTGQSDHSLSPPSYSYLCHLFDIKFILKILTRQIESIAHKLET